MWPWKRQPSSIDNLVQQCVEQIDRGEGYVGRTSYDNLYWKSFPTPAITFTIGFTIGQSRLLVDGVRIPLTRTHINKLSKSVRNEWEKINQKRQEDYLSLVAETVDSALRGLK